MTRSATAFTVAALFALTACGRKGARSSDFDSATTAALGGATSAGSAAAAANAPKVGHVMGIEIGHSLDSANRVILGGSAGFGPGDSVLASVRTIYANAGTPVTVRLRLNDQTIDSTSSKTASADTAGVAIVPFRFAPLKKGGAYQAEVFLDGKFQMATAFKVGS